MYGETSRMLDFAATAVSVRMWRSAGWTARIENLASWAINDNAAPRGGVSCSMALVAGTGFEPVTFRL